MGSKVSQTALTVTLLGPLDPNCGQSTTWLLANSPIAFI